MFAGKAGSLQLSEAPESSYIPVGSSLTRKFQTRLESVDGGKHSSLLQTFVNYGRKKIYNIEPSWPSFCHHCKEKISQSVGPQQVFQARLMLVCKMWNLSLCGALIFGRLCSYSQILDWTEKYARDKHSNLLCPNVIVEKENSWRQDIHHNDTQYKIK